MNQRAQYNDLGGKDLNDLILESNRIPIVLVFTADWLGSAHIMDTFMDDFAMEYEEKLCFYRQDIEQDNKISLEIGIRQLPTTVIFHKGHIVQYFSGVLSKRKIREKLASALL
ncbi:MAG: hypothetical protein DHS20C18_12210 [Saprospiraceae bacterium]|nr:MAG: hypothetical protein DHS20C18_12210 [Saprospiraceae bacterium]